jgi:phospholipid transport system substrate-binding protein
MKSVYRFLFLVLLGTLALALPAEARASEAESYLKGRQAELNTLLKQSKSDTNERKIESVFDQMLDYRTLAKESLNDFWSQRSDSERAEFESVLKQLVQNAYRKSLRKTLDYDVAFVGETKNDESYLVKTVAKSKTNKRDEPISIDYVLHKVDGKWRVYDIVTEGSSLIQNYRNQFRRVIKKKGFDELMRMMRKKLKQGES